MRNLSIPQGAGDVVRTLLKIFVSVMCLAAGRGVSAEPDEFSGASLINGAIFVETGAGSPLVRTNIPWVAPGALTHPALVFTVGFASDEVFAPGEFFDSVTVTVRNSDRSFVAPVLTADMFGLTAAPANPDGAAFAGNQVQPEALGFPALSSTLRFQTAFLVLAVLPPALAGDSGTVGLSLFDNLNARRSVAFINHVMIVPGPGTLMAVDSSASVTGPYATEGGMMVRHARRRIVLPQPSAHRFFRLRGTSPTRLDAIRVEGNQWVFDYTGQGVPALESSAQVIGPYAVESGVEANPLTQTLRLPRDGAARFFRIRCDIPLNIRRLSVGNNQMIFAYE